MSLLLLFGDSNPVVYVDPEWFILDGVRIKPPYSIKESKNPLMAMSRTMDGSYMRDYFSSTKRVWMLTYVLITTTDYDNIHDLYTAYLEDAQPVTWEINQDNYPVTANVHIDMVERTYTVKGSSYISGFDLILTEE